MTAFPINLALPNAVASRKTHRPPPMNEFQWLLVLGFPAETAAATVMPDIFISDENAS